MNGYGQNYVTPEQYGQALQAFDELQRRAQFQQNVQQTGNPYMMIGAAIRGALQNNFGKYKDTSIADQEQILNQYQAQSEAKLAAAAEAKAKREAELKRKQHLEDEAAKRAHEMKIAQMKMNAPTNKMRELEAAGLKPGTAEYTQAMTQRSGQTINVDTGEKYTPFQEKAASKNAEKFNEWESQAIGANETLANISKLREISALQQTGKMNEAAATLGQWLGTDGGAAMQEFGAIQKKMMLDAAANLQGAMSDGEWAVLRAQMPAFGNDPRANEAIMNILTAASERSIKRYQSAADYVQQNGKLQGFRPEFEFAAGNRTLDEPRQESSQEYSEGTIIENAQGQRMVMRNGQWVSQ